MGHCKICCADKMIVGRWYKLVTYAVGYGVPYNYTVTYSAAGENVVLLHDTLYVKSAGAFTVSCMDMYGNTDSKTIQAIGKPTISRTPHSITPTDWADFQSKVTAAGANALISVQTGEYVFALTDTAYTLPAGTVVDFQDSTIRIEPTATTYTGFQIVNDHCGIKNANFVGNMLNDTSYSDQCKTISVLSGDYAELENITFDGLPGFNITIGTWPSFWRFLPDSSASRWEAANNTSGYIGNDGNVIASTGAWTMSEPAGIITTPDRSYYVGHSNMWIPSTVRLYDIAFYDSGMAFLELRKDQQYYRKYYYPEGAAYVRYCVWQDNAPENHTGRDDVCVMRMMAGNAEHQQCLSVREAYIDNIVYANHASGGLSIVGGCEDIHINRMVARGNGWQNGWAFDAEDGWNSMLGVVVTHSYFDKGAIVLHGCQGATLMSCISNSVGLSSCVHFPTMINALVGALHVWDLRGCATLINTYCSGVTNDTGYEATYIFGARTAEENTSMRSRINWMLTIAGH